MKEKKVSRVRILIHLIAGFSAIHLLVNILSETDSGRLLHLSGEYAVWLLILTLACSPAGIIFGWTGSRKHKKALGIYSFVFAALHIAVFLNVNGWRMPVALVELCSELNLIIGCVAALIMFILFITSNKTSIRILKKGWNHLHRLTYLAAVLAIGHVLFIKDDFSVNGLKYAILVVVLLSIRVPVIKGYFINRRKKRTDKNDHPDGGSRSIRPIFLNQIIFVFSSLIVFAGQTNLVMAEEGYRYQDDHGIFSQLFADSKIPVVNHEQTLRSCDTECHTARQPGLLPERSWERILNMMDNHFGKTVAVSEEDQTAVLSYLKQNAADYTKSKFSMKTMNCAEDQTPLRITELTWFKRDHDDIPASVIQQESVQSLSNCAACHIDSQKTGSYDTKNLIVPGWKRKH